MTRVNTSATICAYLSSSGPTSSSSWQFSLNKSSSKVWLLILQVHLGAMCMALGKSTREEGQLSRFWFHHFRILLKSHIPLGNLFYETQLLQIDNLFWIDAGRVPGFNADYLQTHSVYSIWSRSWNGVLAFIISSQIKLQRVQNILGWNSPF